MKRQLIGPIIISLILCGLLADHLFFYQSPWSVAGFLSKVLSIFGAIFATAFNPGLYGWLDEITVPIVIIALIVVLLFLAVARAKLAMSKVTPSVDAALARLAKGGPTSPKASAAPVQASVAPSKLRQYGLMRKLGLLFGSVGVLFGAIVCITVYSFLCRAIEKEVKSRADVMAMHISEMAARQITSGDIQELGVQVDKYAAIRAVAYVYVEDEEGKIIANTPGDLPRHLNRDFPKSAEQALSGTDVQYAVWVYMRSPSKSPAARQVSFILVFGTLRSKRRPGSPLSRSRGRFSLSCSVRWEYSSGSRGRSIAPSSS